MRFKADRATRSRVGMTMMLAVALVLTGCTSDPVATPSAPLTLQSDLSVLAPSTPEPSAMTSGQQTRPSPSSPAARPSIATDTPTSPGPSTVSSTVRPSTPADPPGSSATPLPPTSPPQTSGSTDPTPPTSARTTGGTSPTEAADRKAVEAAWVRYWHVFTIMMSVKKADREKTYSVVAVDPLLSKMLEDASRSDVQKIVNYGTVTHKYSWSLSIQGDEAVFGDCMDQTKFGILDKQNKRFLTGSKNVNNQVTAVRTDGVWKIAGFVEKSGEC